MGNVTLSEFKSTLLRFVEEKIIPDLDDWQSKFMVGFAAKSRFVDSLLALPIVKFCGVTNEDGTVNLDVLKESFDGAFAAQPAIPLAQFGIADKVLDKDVTDAFFKCFPEEENDK